jgi:nicotinate-nucleotide adenylyltransferase
MNTIAIFGGTFDPIHNGHIQTSIAIQKQFNFDSYRFMPCKSPAIKPPTTASTAQRVTMLELALQKYDEFTIDLREVNRETPSYMVETLDSLRKEFIEASITLIIGYDAFLSLPKWHQGEEILKLANLLIINRDDFNSDLIPNSLKTLIEIHKVTDKKGILDKKQGVVETFNAGAYPISSTKIRYALKKQLNVSQLVPEEVYNYINLQGLYQ